MIKRLTPSGRGDHLRQVCIDSYKCNPEDIAFIRAPYRICPLGAHIDHQLGPVSAIAVNHGIEIAFAPDSQRKMRISSDGFGETEFSLSDLGRRTDWSDYAKGAAEALGRDYKLANGVSMAVSGALAESGISSSAAIGLGYLTALSHANGIELAPTELIELDRVIENEFLGLKNGVLDQSAIALAEAGSLTVIDCKTSSHEYRGQPSAFEFLVVYSGLREALIDSSKFNNRVEECLAAGSALARAVTGKSCGPTPLGQNSRDDWQRHELQLDEIGQRRARHFFTESARVLEGADAWQSADRESFGKLMNESCLSSINNYETGSPEMIRLFEVLASASGVYGARFSGAGFRGCAIALIEPGMIDKALDEVAAGYLSTFPQFEGRMWAFTTTAQAGLRIL